MRGQLEARESHLLDRIAGLREQLLEESADRVRATLRHTSHYNEGSHCAGRV